jgi:hypothetical protein
MFSVSFAVVETLLLILFLNQVLFIFIICRERARVEMLRSLLRCVAGEQPHSQSTE